MSPKARSWLIGAGITVAVLSLLVISLFLVKDEVARARFETKLEGVHGFTASVGGAEFVVFERRLVFHDVVLEHEDADGDEPFAIIDRMQVEVDGTMFSKDSKAALTITGADARLIRTPEAEGPVRGLDEQAREDFRDLSRWNTDSIMIEDSTITYVHAALGMDLVLAELDAELRNLAAAKDPERREQVTFSAKGQLETANLELEGASQMGVDRPSFDLHGSIVGMPLVELSPLAQRRAKLEIKDGYATLGVDVQGEDGELSGYFTPHLSKLELEGDEGLRESFKAFVGEVAAEKIDDPFLDESKQLDFTGSYGAGRGFELRAVDEANSWLQDKILAEVG